jgi:predicted nuclease of predicted toxin-antitoxin system
MRFLADANIAARVVAWLRESGHDVWYGPEAGLERLSDAQLFERAALEARIVLTFDLDFGEILAASAGSVSVITFRLRLRRAEHMISRLGQVLATSGDVFDQGRVIVIAEDGRHRVRPLPLRQD